VRAQEAATQSPVGLAIRFDGKERLTVIYSAERNVVVMAKDRTGDFWSEHDPAEADRYHDWEPMPRDPWWIMVANFVEKIWFKIFPRKEEESDAMD
jgi:hypothetical protein